MEGRELPGAPCQYGPRTAGIIRNLSASRRGNYRYESLWRRDELNREIAAFLLKDEGISVTEAEDGQQAVECFLKMPEGYYEAVLMDIMMPAMDGYQAARAIRGSGKKDAETIPIIAMTANAFAEDKRKTMEAGMDAHLSKPLNVPELMETIRKFCVGKQMC